MVNFLHQLFFYFLLQLPFLPHFTEYFNNIYQHLPIFLHLPIFTAFANFTAFTNFYHGEIGILQSLARFTAGKFFFVVNLQD